MNVYSGSLVVMLLQAVIKSRPLELRRKRRNSFQFFNGSKASSEISASFIVRLLLIPS